MNSRIWPNASQIPAIPTTVNSQTELSQALGTLQTLITQFNQLTAMQGSLSLQIQSIVNQLKGLYPYDGVRDAGYVSNAVLKNWPNPHWTLASGGTTFIDATLTGTTSLVLTADMGTLYVLAGSVSLDADGLTGIQKTGDDLILWAGAEGGAVRTDANLFVGGYVALDAGALTGIEKSGTDLVLSAADTDGIVRTSQDFKAGGYLASDGTPGVSTVDGETTLPTGDATFKDGLLVDGSLIADVAVDGAFYVRSNSGEEVADGEWVDLSTFFDGLVADTPWGGSSDIDTLGTVTTGEWQGTEIGVEYGGTGLVALGDPDQVLAVNGTGDALVYVTLDTVPEAPDTSDPYVRFNATGETAGAWELLSTYFDGLEAGTPWTGSDDLVTLGTVTTGEWTGTTIATGYGGTGLTSIGDAEDVLRVNALGTALEYHALTLDDLGIDDWEGSSSIDTLGTITTGTWQGTKIATGYGGTGLTSIGSALQVLRVNSGATALEFADPAGGLPTLGDANQILGVNNAESGVEYKTLSGTTNRVTVTHSGAGIILSGPQDLHTAATPTFNKVTISSSGIDVTGEPRFRAGYIILG